MELPWFVYLLECMDDSLYTGITNNISKRMEVHKRGNGSKYVRSKKFKKLLYILETKNKIEAAKLEYQIKQLTRNEKIDFFLQNPKLVNLNLIVKR
jgi:putative endonuclease